MDDLMNSYLRLPHIQQMQIKEAIVRGTYISIACDYERLLDDIIALCEVDKVFPDGYDHLSSNGINEGLEAYKKTKGIQATEMGKKVKRSKECLEEYNKVHSDSFEQVFKVVSNMVKDRNLMAHGYTDLGLPQEQGKILIHFDNTNKTGKNTSTTIDVQPYLKELAGYRIGIESLMNLCMIIRGEIFGKRTIDGFKAG